MKQEVRD